MVSHSRTSLRTDRLRPLNLPRPVCVALDDSGIPVAVTEEGERRAVATINEVWRVDDEWWRQRIARRYTDMVLEGGAHVVVYQDLITGNWFIQKP